MAMPATEKVWTLDELHALPDDGNKYEVVRGALLVTPAPTAEHETIAARLAEALTPYVRRNDLGHVYRPRAVIRHKGSETEPDLAVRDEIARETDWERAPVPILVVEILSPSTRDHDLGAKRKFYLDAGIPLYWVVDPVDQSIIAIRKGARDVIARERLLWAPSGASEPFELAVQEIFPITSR
jgi:Uma2 family endonuclease